MRAHAISHTNPFIAHLAYVGFTYQFCTPPRPCPAAFFRLTPLAVAVTVASRPMSCRAGTVVICAFACRPSAAYFIGHITKDYSNNGAANSFAPSESNRAVPGSRSCSRSCSPIDASRGDANLYVDVVIKI